MEINYSATDRELLAIVWAIEKWRAYLFARDFTVFTDHRPITYLMTLKEPKGRMARWISRLQEYTFRLKYRRGSDNYVADCLSRLPKRLEIDSTPLLDHETLPQAMNVVSALVFVEDPVKLAEAQRSDPQLENVIKCIQSGRGLESGDSTLHNRYRQIWRQLKLSEEGVLLRCFRHKGVSIAVPVIPASKRMELLEECHGSAHMGVGRTYELIRVNAYWPGLLSDVQKFVTTCGSCQLSTSSISRNKAPLQPIFTAKPMETWAMDIMGPLPCTASDHRYILVATDLFSKWVEAVPLVDQTASTVARAFVENCVLRFGPPCSLLTDQGSNFESMLMKEVCRLLGVDKVRTSPFHPRTDGQTERTNRTIKEWIASSGGPWERELPFITFAMNCTPNSATKVSPFQLVYGRHPPMIGLRSGEYHRAPESSFGYVEHLRRKLKWLNQYARSNSVKSKEDTRRRYDASNGSADWMPFRVGDKVRYRNHYPDRLNRKFSARFRGPYWVRARKGVNYRIDGGKERARWVHHDELLPWRSRAVVQKTGSTDGGAREEQANGDRGVQEVGMDAGSSSDEDGGACGVAGSAEEACVRRSGRVRRAPAWMRDYVS